MQEDEEQSDADVIGWRRDEDIIDLRVWISLRMLLGNLRDALFPVLFAS
jgi:hypothetical protein